MLSDEAGLRALAADERRSATNVHRVRHVAASTAVETAVRSQSVDECAICVAVSTDGHAAVVSTKKKARSPRRTGFSGGSC